MASDLVPFNELPMSIASPVKGRVFTSYDATTAEGKKMIYRALQSAELTSADGKRAPFPVQDVLMHPVMMTDEKTGEIIEATRVVLIQPDGKRMQFVSSGIAKSVGQIAALIRRPPWNPAINVQVNEIDMGNGKRFFELNYIDG